MNTVNTKVSIPHWKIGTGKHLQTGLGIGRFNSTLEDRDFEALCIVKSVERFQFHIGRSGRKEPNTTVLKIACFNSTLEDRDSVGNRKKWTISFVSIPHWKIGTQIRILNQFSFECFNSTLEDRDLITQDHEKERFVMFQFHIGRSGPGGSAPRISPIFWFQFHIGRSGPKRNKEID